MSIAGLIVSAILALIAVAVVARPFFRSRSARAVADVRAQRQRERIQIYYERILTNIGDLDEDFHTGKIAELEYRGEREIWIERGIRLLKVRDQLDLQQSLLASGRSDDDEIDRAIEAAVQAYREGNQPVYHDYSDGEAGA